MKYTFKTKLPSHTICHSSTFPVFVISKAYPVIDGSLSKSVTLHVHSVVHILNSPLVGVDEYVQSESW